MYKSFKGQSNFSLEPFGLLDKSAEFNASLFSIDHHFLHTKLMLWHKEKNITNCCCAKALFESSLVAISLLNICMCPSTNSSEVKSTNLQVLTPNI